MRLVSGPAAPDKTVDLAIAVLGVATRLSASSGGEPVYPPALFDRPRLPRELKGYSRSEVEQASRMLIRLGYLEAPKAA